MKPVPSHGSPAVLQQSRTWWKRKKFLKNAKVFLNLSNITVLSPLAFCPCYPPPT
jgi:hypothetical protein